MRYRCKEYWALASSMRNVTSATGKQRARPLHSNLLLHAGQAADGIPPMNLYHNISGWTLLFALLTCAVIIDGFAIWMGWLSTH